MSSSMVNTRRGLAGWVWEIDLSGWFAPSIPFPDARDGIADTLRMSGWNLCSNPVADHGVSLNVIADAMEVSDSPRLFDGILGWVYDMADRDRVHIITGPDRQPCVVV